jgi:uncharacterized membrane protein YtjA (UPF0391 family)
MGTPNRGLLVELLAKAQRKGPVQGLDALVRGNPPPLLLDVAAPGLDMAKAVKTSGMLYYTLIFLVVALAAGLLGFLALAGIAAMIARVLFVLFLVFFLISLVQRRRL